MTVLLDPTDEREPVARRITPRPSTFAGAIGLLDISKPRGNVLLDELQSLLAVRLPGIELKRYRKPTFAKPAPDELRQRMRAECAYVVEALAD